MLSRLVIILLLLSPLATSTGCDDPTPESPDAAPYVPPPPPSDQQITDACAAYADISCHQFDTCGVLSQSIDRCKTDRTAKCVADTKAKQPGCWKGILDALARCGADFADDACTDFCTDSGGLRFCHEPICFYLC